MVEKFGMLHISTGDLLREAVSNETESGTKAKKYMDAGELVPDEVILGIMRDKFKHQGGQRPVDAFSEIVSYMARSAQKDGL